jgi:hypothetical protein
MSSYPVHPTCGAAAPMQEYAQVGTALTAKEVQSPATDVTVVKTLGARTVVVVGAMPQQLHAEA